MATQERYLPVIQNVIERILNLLAFLLTTDHPVSAEEIRYTVAGYGDKSDEAFRRTFERDKDLLRQIGVPLELEATDLFEVEFGYVIPDEEYALVDPGPCSSSVEPSPAMPRYRWGPTSAPRSKPWRQRAAPSPNGEP